MDLARRKDWSMSVSMTNQCKDYEIEEWPLWVFRCDFTASHDDPARSANGEWV